MFTGRVKNDRPDINRHDSMSVIALIVATTPVLRAGHASDTHRASWKDQWHD